MTDSSNILEKYIPKFTADEKINVIFEAVLVVEKSSTAPTSTWIL